MSDPDKALLEALREGSAKDTMAALGSGADPKMGITFMFKIHKLHDKTVSVALIKLLQDGIKAAGSGNTYDTT